MTKEQKFFNALKDIFIGAKVEGESGYINLMRIKSRYYEKGVFLKLHEDIEKALKPFPHFRDELFDKLYTFFYRYFSESGSIYFRYTPLHQNVYEKVYTDDKDVMLFYKTHMLYYVKTDRLFKNLEVEIDGQKFFFDVSTLEHKKANEKREIIYSLKDTRKDGAIVFSVAHSEKGKKTKVDEILKSLKKSGVKLNEELLDRALRVFEKQSEVDYFINKNAKAFLQEQFSLWLYQYVFSGESEWTETRIRQLQTLKDIAFKIIAFISQFEDELVKIWNKPKFVLNSNYVITIDKIADKNIELVEQMLKHPHFKKQIEEWQELGIVDGSFKKNTILLKDPSGENLNNECKHLPIDTKYFKDLEHTILGMFDNLDEALDGRLIKSENYHALNTFSPKYNERVKCIYIDPPYNTGSDEFIYKDKYQHSSWLTMMADRLNLATRYLQQHGVLLVSIDEVEAANLQLILDQIVGRQNYIATFVWEGGRKNDSKLVSISHEYIICYAKNLEALERAHVTWGVRKEGIDDIYRKAESLRRKYGKDYLRISKSLAEWLDGLPDNHPAKRQKHYRAVDERGVYFPSDIGWHGGDGPKYTVLHPLTKKPCKVPERGWMYPTKERMQEAIQYGMVHFWEDHTRVPCAKAYLKDNEYEVLNSVFYRDRRGASKRLRNYLGRDMSGRDVFENPKDELLLNRLIQPVVQPGEYVLDFFAGSGSTAHAVTNLNQRDRGNRKYIMVEMGDWFETVLLPRIKKRVYCDKWKDGKSVGGEGVSYFIKYFRLEQYDDTLQRVKYDDSDLFDDPNQNPYNQYVFLRDLKMLEALDVDLKKNKVKVDLSKLYEGIDIAETLSNLKGKWIKRISKDSVEFADGETVDLKNLDYKLIKPLIWW
jgi:adenine-specific DNA-methyltransferase